MCQHCYIYKEKCLDHTLDEWPFWLQPNFNKIWYGKYGNDWLVLVVWLRFSFTNHLNPINELGLISVLAFISFSPAYKVVVMITTALFSFWRTKAAYLCVTGSSPCPVWLVACDTNILIQNSVYVQSISCSDCLRYR